jgi:hypothetical protein
MEGISCRQWRFNHLPILIDFTSVLPTFQLSSLIPAFVRHLNGGAFSVKLECCKGTVKGAGSASGNPY